jgi:hypothetical protein
MGLSCRLFKSTQPSHEGRNWYALKVAILTNYGDCTLWNFIEPLCLATMDADIAYVDTVWTRRFVCRAPQGRLLWSGVPHLLLLSSLPAFCSRAPLMLKRPIRHRCWIIGENPSISRSGMGSTEEISQINHLHHSKTQTRPLPENKAAVAESCLQTATSQVGRITSVRSNSKPAQHLAGNILIEDSAPGVSVCLERLLRDQSAQHQADHGPSGIVKLAAGWIV